MPADSPPHEPADKPADEVVTLIEEGGGERRFRLHDAFDVEGGSYYLVEAEEDADIVLLLREVDGEIVLLNIATERYYGLDAVGATMVKMLVEQPRDAVVELMLKVYRVDRERLVADMDSLIIHLGAAGLLVSSQGD